MCSTNGSLLNAFCRHIWVNLRSTLDSQGANSLEAELHDIAALGGELVATALEALLVEDNDLRKGKVLSKFGENVPSNLENLETQNREDE